MALAVCIHVNEHKSPLTNENADIPFIRVGDQSTNDNIITQLLCLVMGHSPSSPLDLLLALLARRGHATLFPGHPRFSHPSKLL